MRSRIIAGSGQAHGTALVNEWGGSPFDAGRLRTIGVPGAQSDNTNTLANVIHAVITAAGWVANLFHIGPSYDPANGGELARQFGHDGGTGWLGQPWCNSMMDWYKKYRPAVWSGAQDVWTCDMPPTPWKTIYDKYVAAGMPEGALLDGNMKPVGLDEAVAASQTQTQGQSAQGITQAQLDALNIMAMQIAGMSGPTVAAQVAAQVATMPKAWQDYVTQMAAIWVSNMQANGGNQGGGGNAGGGTGTQGGGLMNTLLAVGAAKLLGVF